MNEDPNEDPNELGRALVTRASAALDVLSWQVTRQISAFRAMLRAEETRHKLFVIVGRFTAHTAIIFVSLVAIVLAGLRSGTASPSASANDSAKIAKSEGLGRSPTILTSVTQPGGLGNVQLPGGAQDGVVMRDVTMDAAAKTAAGAVVAGSETQTRPAAAARTELISYKVQPGDVIESIAARFGLQPTTVVWANQDVEDNPDLLKVGQELTILPTDGLYYTVRSGDTLAAIARKYKADADAIQNYPLNTIADGLQAGVQIVIPNGVKPDAVRVAAPAASVRRLTPIGGVVANAGTATGSFSWPIVGTITQGFWSYHRALDIANSTGTPIYASDGGYVSYAGWSNVGYGYMVKIEHANGFSTLYGHMSFYYVEVGQYVGKGQNIGLVGSTGNSTGPHVHFEIRYNGVPQNPYSYLP